MSARDELRKYANLLADSWTPRQMTDDRVEYLYGLVSAETRREWAAKIRETGAAKGWSTWAAAFIDPDVEFVDTGMPSTETIVAELRRLDRAAAFRDAAEALEREQAREERAERERFGHLDHETELQGAAVRAKATFLRRLADGIEQGKDTSGGSQPPAGESTPDFFQPGHTYTYACWQFRCDVVTTHPGTGRRTALGWFRANGGEWRSFNATEDEWAEDAWKATVTESGES